MFSTSIPAGFDGFKEEDEIIYQANTDILHDHWQSSQKNNISENTVEKYARIIEEKKEIKPIIISSLQEDHDSLSIRLADGRHRLSAFYKKKCRFIPVKVSTEVANELAVIFPELLTPRSDNQDTNKPLFSSRL